jgi:hypothetical protein
MTPREQALKRASRDLVAAAGGCEMADALCRVQKSQLSAAGSVTEPGRWLPVDAVRDLEAVTHGTAGHPQVTRFLAAEAGYALVKLRPTPCDPLQAIGQLSREAADVVHQLVLNQAGMASATDTIRECDELLALVAGIRAAAQALERGIS